MFESNSRSTFFLPKIAKKTLIVPIVIIGLVACFQVTARSQDNDPNVASKVTHPIVLGYERFYREVDFEESLDEEIAQDEIDAGLLLLGELNCTSCHRAEPNITKQFVLNKKAPNLKKVGTRLHPEYFARMLQAPHLAKPGTTMPDLLGALPQAERQQTAKELAAFLVGGDSAPVGSPVSNQINQGRKLFESIGCTACHDRQEKDATTLADSIPLGDLMSKYTFQSLQKFLKNPLEIRSSARMPHLNLDDKETTAIASYLLRDLKVETKINFKYYQGSWKELPDFPKLKPKAEGISSGFDLSGGKNSFGFVFSGFLHLTKDGKYKLHLGSDDGSRLVIDGDEIVNVDGIHPTQHKTGTATLTKGTHEIVVEYFDGGGQRELVVEIEGPGVSRQPIASLITPTKEKLEKPEEQEKPTLNLTPEMAKKGREHFATLGCANCHRGDVKPSTDELLSPPSLTALKEGGCLNDSPAAGIPNYRLTQRQKKVIQSALTALKADQLADEELASDKFIHRKLLSMNCFACHSRNDFGGVAKDREDAFKGTQQEMGAEGQIPPILTGVGAKLTSGQLRKVIETGHKDRPYMLTRMPRFGGEGVELAKLIEKVDISDERWANLKPIEIGPDISTRKLKLHGRKFAGGDMLQCIKCHQFGKNKATGIQALSMTTMTDRLREDWFIEYMLKPSDFRPGTRMPESWPGGKSFYKELNGDPRLQAYSLWVFLSDKDKAQKPPGLEESKLEIVAKDETRIYRNFIEGAGSRAIGIGFPEKVNFAFDANQNRLALLWHGAFIDAGRHWTGRGQGYQPPLGDNLLTLDDKVSFAKLESESAEWPGGTAKELGIRFKGYRLNEQRHPTFMYKFGEAQIEDSIAPIAAKKEGEFGQLQRTLTINSPGEGIYFRAAIGDKIEELENNLFKIDDWKMQIQSAKKPMIRESNGKKELLVPAKSGEAKSKIDLRYHW